MQNRVNIKTRRLAEKRRAAANRRWAKDAARRDAMERECLFRGTPLRRVVVIDREVTVRECVIYEWDSARSARRKIAEALAHSGETP